jgi:hypothetical protein
LARQYLDGSAVEQLHEASHLTRQACPWKWRDALTVDVWTDFRGIQDAFML